MTTEQSKALAHIRVLDVSRVLAGPTCDSIDVIREDMPLPELQIGDFILGRMMGAYTAASASDFNFMPRARIVTVGQRALRRAD